MKGNKALTYVLIAGVLLVWGIIFYRMFMTTASGQEPRAFKQPIVSELKKKSLVKDSFELLLNYSDPFLSNGERAANGFRPSFSTSGNSNTVAIVKKKEKVKETLVEIDWNFISYLGLVANKVQKKNIGLVLINKKEYMINEGDRIEDVTILKKGKDSVQISYKEQKKWIKRQ